MIVHINNAEWKRQYCKYRLTNNVISCPCHPAECSTGDSIKRSYPAVHEQLTIMSLATSRLTLAETKSVVMANLPVDNKTWHLEKPGDSLGNNYQSNVTIKVEYLLGFNFALNEWCPCTQWPATPCASPRRLLNSFTTAGRCAPAHTQNPVVHGVSGIFFPLSGAHFG